MWDMGKDAREKQPLNAEEFEIEFPA